MATVVSREGLEGIVAALRREGRTVLGPIVRDGAVTHDTIESIDDLPIGWTDEQAGGRYRLAPADDGEVFGFSSPSSSWKCFVYPERTLLVRARRSGTKITVEEPQPDNPRLAFFGIRSCDLAALAVLDRVFLDPEATDPTYASRRADVFVVAAGCARPGGTCFCASMDTGPSPRSGFDLAVTELEPGTSFLVESGSDRGAALLSEIAGRPPTEADHERAGTIHERAVERMGRTLDPADPPVASRHPEHPRWDDVAERCLACGNCTMVCPTCFCSTTEDSTDLTGAGAERWRVWDSCFTLDFTHLHGGSVRTSTSARYRQWLLHKLVTWHDQFGTSGCVGCGRCITWCPVGIDLTVEIAALARTPEDGSP